MDGALVLTETAAVLVHLAETTGRLLPTSDVERAHVFEQLFFHASALGPAFGQSGSFQRLAAEPQPIAIARFSGEGMRTMRVLDAVLSERRVAAGDAFTIADIAQFGWLRRRAFAGIELADFPHVARWYLEIEARPVVQRAAAGGFDAASADAILCTGDADAVAFGRAFIANPDLPERLRLGLALTPYGRDTSYGGDARGYTDYPFHDRAAA